MDSLIKRSARRYAAGLVLVAAFVVPAYAAEDADSEKVTVVGNISYVSGGIGEESRERMKAFAAAFNLRLLLARKSGEYLGNVEVLVADGKGREVLRAVAEGPIFMANLPPGSYEVAATVEGQTLKQRVSVLKGPSATVHFRWP